MTDLPPLAIQYKKALEGEPAWVAEKVGAGEWGVRRLGAGIVGSNMTRPEAELIVFLRNSVIGMPQDCQFCGERIKPKLPKRGE